MTNMYEAGETLAMVEQIVEAIADKPAAQTPDGRDPVYWPITIYGQTGMLDEAEVKSIKNDPIPPES